MACDTCHYWKQIAQAPELTEEGECRRHAPKPVILATDAAQRVDVYWPKTKATEFCGEWKEEM
jgi:hypothetical protein